MQKHLKNTWLIKICTSASLLALFFPFFVVQAQEAGGELNAEEPLAEQQVIIDEALPEQQKSYGHYFQGWQIDGFDAVIKVREDGTILVQETIDTQFNPTKNKHGIFREIPFVYTDRLGNHIKVDLTILDVKQNGESATFKVTNSGSYKNIRIGDGDIEIGGPIQYQLTYEVGRAMLFFDDYDELYWNVTGDLWEVPIANVTAFVQLPEGAEVTSIDCYTGGYGSTEDDCGFAYQDASAAFSAGDFLTVAVGFPKGFIPEPTFMDRVLYFLTDNWVGVIPIGIIAVVALYWYVKGRDPKMGIIIAEFEPPDDMKAVYAGFLTFNRYTSQLNGAMIIQLAVDGYLRIDVEERKGLKGRKVHLEKLKSNEGLDAIHKRLFDAMFRSGTRVSVAQLRMNVGRKMTVAQIKKDLVKKFEKEKIYTKASFTRRTLLASLVVVPLMMFPFITGNAYGTFASTMFVVAAVVTAVFAWFMPKRTIHGTKLARRVYGFKDFMHTAERYRSQWHEEQLMFEKYLPYAIAFNDVKKWANTFKDLDVVQPSWYRSNMHTFSALHLADSLSTTTRSLGMAMHPQSQSSSGGRSGSYGGGFSGGGFGGGGGGSW